MLHNRVQALESEVKALKEIIKEHLPTVYRQMHLKSPHPHDEQRPYQHIAGLVGPMGTHPKQEIEHYERDESLIDALIDFFPSKPFQTDAHIMLDGDIRIEMDDLL